MTERNSRSMNHMDPDTKEIHVRLEEWASWAKESEIRAWPSITLLGRVIEQGISGAGQSGRAPVSMPDRVATIDAAVARLGDVDRKAIRLYYLQWAPPEQLARRMDRSMRSRQFLNVVRRARWRIAGFVDAHEVLNAISR